MSPEQELQKARDAQRWLDDPLTQEFRHHVYAALESARRSIPTTDSARCADVIRTEQIADMFFRQAELRAQTGRFADNYLAQEEARKQGLMARLKAYQVWGRNGL